MPPCSATPLSDCLQASAALILKNHSPCSHLFSFNRRSQSTHLCWALGHGRPSDSPARPRRHSRCLSPGGGSVTGPRALFCCPSISQLLLPAHKFHFQRPLCTSGACDYPETRSTKRGQERKQGLRGGSIPRPSLLSDGYSCQASRLPGRGGRQPPTPSSPLPCHLPTSHAIHSSPRFALSSHHGQGSVQRGDTERTGQRPTQSNACREEQGRG